MLTQYIYTDLGLQSPFMMTFIANSLFVVYLPLWQLWLVLGVVKRNPRMGDLSILTQSSQALAKDIQASSLDEHDDDAAATTHTNYTHMHALRAALIIAPLYFLANCLYNYSLFMTSVSSSTIISNLAASFTLLFSWLAGLESITLPKVSGLLLCFCGAIAVGLNDAEGSKQVERSVSGDLVALLAAMGYGAYTTLIRLQLPDEESVSMQLVLGYIGLVVLCACLPVILLLLALGVHQLQWQVSWTALGFIVLGGLCDNVFSDYLWARAVVLTSPTVATVGMSITIPFAMLSDLMLQKSKAPPLGSLAGAGLVICGFCLVNAAPDSLSKAAQVTLELLGCAKRSGGGDEAGGVVQGIHSFSSLSSSHCMLPSGTEEVDGGREGYDGGGVGRTASDDSSSHSDTAFVSVARIKS